MGLIRRTSQVVGSCSSRLLGARFQGSRVWNFDFGIDFRVDLHGDRGWVADPVPVETRVVGHDRFFYCGEIARVYFEENTPERFPRRKNGGCVKWVESVTGLPAGSARSALVCCLESAGPV